MAASSWRRSAVGTALFLSFSSFLDGLLATQSGFGVAAPRYISCFCRSPATDSVFSRLSSSSGSLADWSAPAIASPLPPDGRRWSSPTGSVRCPVLRGGPQRDSEHVRACAVRGCKRGCECASDFLIGLTLAGFQSDASCGGARSLSACFCDFCGTGVFMFSVFPRFPRIPFKCVCVCVCV